MNKELDLFDKIYEAYEACIAKHLASMEDYVNAKDIVSKDEVSDKKRFLSQKMKKYEIVDDKRIQCTYERSELAGLYLGKDYEDARRDIMTEYKLREWAARAREIMEAEE